MLRVGERAVDCKIQDISTRGVALAIRGGLPPGMAVRVVFRLPNARQPLEVAGVVVRQAGARTKSTVGLELVDPDADTVRAIETFVARNRSDRPFSRDREGPDTDRIQVAEDAAALRGLYREAVDQGAEQRGGRWRLFDRWRRRRG